MENNQIDFASLNYGAFREAVRKTIRKALNEKNQAEIKAEKDEIDARVKQTEAQIKALQTKLAVLKKQQGQVSQQKPDEIGG